MKKLLIFILSIIILSSCTFIVFALGDETEILPANGYSLGDVDMNRIINVKDATAVQKNLVELLDFNSQQLTLADVDLSGAVNIKDATYIQKQVAGLVPPAVIKPPTNPITTSSSVSDEETPEPESSAPVYSTTAPFTEPVATDAPITSEPETSVPETEAPVETETEITEPETEAPTEATTEKPAQDNDKPIELPFIPAH